MKRLSLVCLFSLIAIVLLASICYAGPFDREEFKNVGYVDSITKTSSSSFSSSPCYVYAVTVYATSSNAYANLYDSTDGSGSVVIENAEATQYQSQRVEFTKPVRFQTGGYVAVVNGYAVIEYRQ